MFSLFSAEYYRPPDKSGNWKTIFFISHPKHMLWVLKREGVQRLIGRVLDSRLKGRRFEPHWLHCIVALSKNINPSLVLVQPRKTRPLITERLLMGRKETNQTKTKEPSQ